MNRRIATGIARDLIRMARELVSMTMMKRYIEIDEEDDLRREFDEMVARGRIKSKSFDSWMRNVNHYRYDEKEGKYYNIEQE